MAYYIINVGTGASSISLCACDTECSLYNTRYINGNHVCTMYCVHFFKDFAFGSIALVINNIHVSAHHTQQKSWSHRIRRP